MDAAERAARLALIEKHGAMTMRLRAVAEMVEKRKRDVAEADSLTGGGWLGDRARRKTRELLLDAETKHDKEIEKVLVKNRELAKALDEDRELWNASNFALWKGSLNASISPEERYVEEADRLITEEGVEGRPFIPDLAWDLMALILKSLNFPEDTDDPLPLQLATRAFLLFFAETWDDVDPQRVDELIDQAYTDMNQQRAQAGKAPVSADDPKGRFISTGLWWVADASGAIVPLRTYIESQPAYQRLDRVRTPYFGDGRDSNTVWNTGIASAVAWLFVAKEGLAEL